MRDHEVDDDVRASLCKRLRFVADETLREHRNLTAINDENVPFYKSRHASSSSGVSHICLAAARCKISALCVKYQCPKERSKEDEARLIASFPTF